MALFVALAAPTVGGAIARESVLKRAESWIDKGVPYSQSGYATTSGYVARASSATWRRDCSGFTSMCLDLRRSDGSAMSLSTATLETRLAVITGTSTERKAKLRPGDIIMRPNDLEIDGERVPYGHAVVFVRWIDAAKTRYVGYHQSGGRGRAVAQEIVYPFWGEKGFRAYRYKGLEPGKLRKSRAWRGAYSPPQTDLTIFNIGVASPLYPGVVVQSLFAAPPSLAEQATTAP